MSKLLGRKLNKQKYWLDFWEKKADALTEQTALGRSSYGILELMLLVSDIKKALKLNENDRLLDIGCAGGILDVLLSPLVKEIYALDPLKKMIKRAKRFKKHFKNIKFLKGKIPKLKFPDKFFDKVYCGSIFQYLNNQKEVEKSILEIKRILKDNGLALIGSNPDIKRKKWFIKSYDRLNWPEEKKKEAIKNDHLHLWFDFERIKKIGKKLSLKVIKSPINKNLWHRCYMFDFLITKK